MTSELSARQRLELLIKGGTNVSIVRGPEVSSGLPTPYSTNPNTWPLSPSGDRCPQVNWGGLSLPLEKANLHFLIAGVPGTGKTLTIRHLLQSVVAGTLPGKDRAIVYDPKQEFYPIVRGAVPEPHTVFLLNPFDRRCHCWDLAADFTTPAAAHQLASSVIPCPPTVTNPFFPKAAAAVLAAVISVLIEKKKHWDLHDAISKCLSLGALCAFLERNKTPYTLMALANLGTGETAKNVHAELSSRLYVFMPLAAHWRQARERGRVVSLRDFKEKQDAILILGANQQYSTAIQAINQLLLKRLSEIVLDSPLGSWKAENRTWVILDELRELGEIPGLADLINKGRSRGVCGVLGFQDYPGLCESFGEKRAHELTASCAHKIFLRLQGESAEWASRCIGRAEIAETQYTYSGGSNIAYSGSTSTNSSNTSSSMGPSYTSGSSRQFGINMGSNQAVTMTVTKRETDAVMASEIAHLPNFDDGRGLNGFQCEFGTGDKASVRRLAVPKELFLNTLRADSGEAGFEEWGADAQDFMAFVEPEELMPSATPE